jgi:hypothetical protein
VSRTFDNRSTGVGVAAGSGGGGGSGSASPPGLVGDGGPLPLPPPPPPPLATTSLSPRLLSTASPVHASITAPSADDAPHEDGDGGCGGWVRAAALASGGGDFPPPSSLAWQRHWAQLVPGASPVLRRFELEEAKSFSSLALARCDVAAVADAIAVTCGPHAMALRAVDTAATAAWGAALRAAAAAARCATAGAAREAATWPPRAAPLAPETLAARVEADPAERDVDSVALRRVLARLGTSAPLVEGVLWRRRTRVGAVDWAPRLVSVWGPPTWQLELRSVQEAETVVLWRRRGEDDLGGGSGDGDDGGGGGPLVLPGPTAPTYRDLDGASLLPARVRDAPVLLAWHRVDARATWARVLDQATRRGGGGGGGGGGAAMSS